MKKQQGFNSGFRWPIYSGQRWSEVQTYLINILFTAIKESITIILFGFASQMPKSAGHAFICM